MNHNIEQPPTAGDTADIPADAGYRGVFDSVTAYADALIEDLGSDRLLDELLPPGLRQYVRVDTDALGRDLVIGGTIRVEPNPDGRILVFDGR